MIRQGKRNILGIMIDVADYEATVDAVAAAARDKRPFIVTALAVHGVMTGVLDQRHRYRLNNFDLAVPDGQPVRWALNWLYGAKLRGRVYGPTLTLAICQQAEKEGLPVYFYGSTPEILSGLKENLHSRFPKLVIAGFQSSKFGRLNLEEKDEVTRKIRESGASIVFVGLGCPRQEVWAYEFRKDLSIPILAVGAAFPFIAGMLPQAPRSMQEHGLEWLFRFWTEPGRLWRRYLILNPAFLLLLLLQVLRILNPSSAGTAPAEEMPFG